MARELSSPEDFKELLSLSEESPQWLFKLSPICPTSLQAEYEMETFAKKQQEAGLWRINVIAQRPLSREIASTISVQHESPQAILFHKGKVLWHGSHYSVSVRQLEKAMA